MGLEHEIELHGRGELVSGQRRLDLELVDDVLHFLGAEVIQLDDDVVATSLGLGGGFLLGFNLKREVKKKKFMV